MPHTGFSLVEECRLSSCSQWDVSFGTREGIHVPCTGSRLLTTGLLGKPPLVFFKHTFLQNFHYTNTVLKSEFTLQKEKKGGLPSKKGKMRSAFIYKHLDVQNKWDYSLDISCYSQLQWNHAEDHRGARVLILSSDSHRS